MFAKSLNNFNKHSTQLIRFFSEKSSDLIIQKLNGKHSGVTVLGLNRPKQKNALGSNLMNELNRAIDDLYYESNSRILIIRSLVPGVFGAGADLKERQKMNEKDVVNFVRKTRTVFNKIYNLPIPVIAAIDGLALGGGLELALSCDIRIADSQAKLGLVETRLAIIPGAGGTQILPRLLNPAIAKQLIYTAKVIDGLKGKELGLINEIVEQTESKDAAYLKSLQLAEEILPNGPIALKMAKAAINKGLETDISTGLAIEEACYAQVVPTKDRLEGLKAFTEKRTPTYIGE